MTSFLHLTNKKIQIRELIKIRNFIYYELQLKLNIVIQNWYKISILNYDYTTDIN